MVTSYAEVWIEIMLGRMENIGVVVTSYAEVWIEISMDIPFVFTL